MSKDSHLGLFNGASAKRAPLFDAEFINGIIRYGLTTPWDAPPRLKAQLAILIIWTVVCFLQLALLLKRLRHVARAYRPPFILLAAITFLLGGGYISYTFDTRLSTLFVPIPEIEWNFKFAYNFVYCTNDSLLPAVCLYLLHLRGDALRGYQGTTLNPLMSRKWKKIFDWVWIGLLYLLYVVQFSLFTRSIDGYNHNQIDVDTYHRLRDQSNNLEHVVVAFKLFVYLDLIISSIITSVQVKKQGIVDLTVKRLLIGASPLFFVLFIESLTYHVLWWSMESDYEGRKLLLFSHFIVDGLARTSIVWVLISIMVVPGVVRDNIPSEGAGVLSSGYPSQTTPYTADQQQYPWQINGYQQPSGQQGVQVHPALLQSWHPQPNWQQQSQPVMQYVVIKKQNQYAPPQNPPPGWQNP